MMTNHVNAEVVDSSSVYIVADANKIPVTLSEANTIIQTQQSDQHQQSVQTKTPVTAQAGSYSFPQELNEGYWAMTTTIDGIAVTVGFSDNYIHIHQFLCHPDATYERLETFSYELEPSQNGMGLKREDGSHFSELKLMSFKPQQTLFMHQNFLANYELKEAMPNGIDLKYIYTPSLIPACPFIN